MTKRILFHHKHLDLIELAPGFDEILNLDGVRFSLSLLPTANADALTLMCDGKIICCFGYIQILPGVAEVWLFPSVYAKDRSIVLVKEVSGYLESTAKVRGWHRIQTVTQQDAGHLKWMEVLGFCEEGVMERYFNKKNYVMSARYF